MHFIVMPMRDITKIPVERGGVDHGPGLPNLPIFEHCHSSKAETFRVYLSHTGKPASWVFVEGFENQADADFMMSMLKVHDSGEAVMNQAIEALSHATLAHLKKDPNL
jgi:hypothetical protein